MNETIDSYRKDYLNPSDFDLMENEIYDRIDATKPFLEVEKREILIETWHDYLDGIRDFDTKKEYEKQIDRLLKERV